MNRQVVTDSIPDQSHSELARRVSIANVFSPWPRLPHSLARRQGSHRIAQYRGVKEVKLAVEEKLGKLGSRELLTVLFAEAEAECIDVGCAGV